MKDIYQAFGEMIAGMSEAHASGVRTGSMALQLRMAPAIDALEREFKESLKDEETRMKSSLQVAIANVIALSRIERENAYACDMVKRDQLARHEGRPEHDTTAWGTPMKAGA
jgi:hypothetical protein